jgi:hypothetical protein
MISGERSIKKKITQTSNLKMISGEEIRHVWHLRTRCSYSLTLVFTLSAIVVTALEMMNYNDHYVHSQCVTDMSTTHEHYLHLQCVKMMEDVV